MNNLKAIRIKAGLSQKAVALALKVTTQAVSKWETGEANPKTELLPALADLLNCTIDALFGREDHTTE